MKVKDFLLDTNKSNISEITLIARYPEKGRVLNTKSEMVVYVLKGKATLNQNNKNKKLTKGSVVLVKAKEEYFWTPDPKVTLLIFSTPAWTLKQQRMIPNQKPA